MLRSTAPRMTVLLLRAVTATVTAISVTIISHLTYAAQHCSSYDAQVSEWLWGQTEGKAPPPQMTVPLQLQATLRYGENPHQVWIPPVHDRPV